jgi:hypothetical protein
MKTVAAAIETISNGPEYVHFSKLLLLFFFFLTSQCVEEEAWVVGAYCALVSWHILNNERIEMRKNTDLV